MNSSYYTVGDCYRRRTASSNSDNLHVPIKLLMRIAPCAYPLWKSFPLIKQKSLSDQTAVCRSSTSSLHGGLTVACWEFVLSVIMFPVGFHGPASAPDHNINSAVNTSSAMGGGYHLPHRYIQPLYLREWGIWSHGACVVHVSLVPKASTIDL